MLRSNNNRYVLMFNLSVLLAFALFMAITCLVYVGIIELPKLEHPQKFWSIGLATFAFLLACMICMPIAFASFFFDDDNTWEARLLSLYHTLRTIELKKKDLQIESSSYKFDEAKYQKFKTQMFGCDSKGTYIDWDKFETFQKDILEKIATHCGPSAGGREMLLEVETETNHMKRLNNTWFRRTTWFLLGWSILCVIALLFSFYFLTACYQPAFYTWYKFPPNLNGRVMDYDLRVYVEYTTIEGLFSDIVEFFREDLEKKVEILAAVTKIIKGYEYAFRTLISVSLVLFVISIKRIANFYRKRREIKKRVGLA